MGTWEDDTIQTQVECTSLKGGINHDLVFQYVFVGDSLHYMSCCEVMGTTVKT